MRLENVTDTTILSIDQIKQDRELARQIQEILVYRFFLLEPPVDENFGSLSTVALKDFQQKTGCPNIGVLDSQTAGYLIDSPREKLVTLNLTDDVLSRIVAYMLEEGYYISLGEKCYNIVYVEGMNVDGTLNNDAEDKFNDLRCLIEIVNGSPRFAGKWAGTCEPGRYWTTWGHRQARGWERGAARIKFGQYRAWRVGIHNGNHEALINPEEFPVDVYRDVNEDMVRTGDPLDKTYGINQHHGYMNDVSSTVSIGGASAGCLVGQTIDEHKKFMELVKSDVRYQASNAQPGNPQWRNYRFITTVVPGNEVLRTRINEDDLSRITWIDIFRNPEGKTVVVGMKEGTALRKWIPQNKAELIGILEGCHMANSVLIASADKPIPEI